MPNFGKGNEVPCSLALDEAADRVLCGLKAISTPALIIISFTHRDIVLFEISPNGFIVLIKSFTLVLKSLVLFRYSEITATIHNFSFFGYFLKKYYLYVSLVWFVLKYVMEQCKPDH